MTDYDGAFSLNPDEAEDARWISFEALAEELRVSPERFTVWFQIAAPEVLRRLKKENTKP